MSDSFVSCDRRLQMHAATRFHPRIARICVAICLAAIAATLVLAQTARADGRGQGGNAGHTGLSPVVSSQTGRLQQIGWPYFTNGIITGGAVVASGTVYEGSADGRLYAINPNGLVKWAVKLGTNIASTPTVGPNGLLYVVNSAGKLYSVSSSGKARYLRSLGLGAPAVVSYGRALYAGGAHGIYALGLNGQRRWYHHTAAEVTGISAGPHGGVFATTAKTTKSSQVIALTKSGKTRWAGKVIGFANAPTVGSSGNIYVTTQAGYLVALNSAGKLRWSRRVQGVIAASATLRRSGGVYIGMGIPGHNGSLRAFNSAGKQLWSYRTSDSNFDSPTVGGDGTIYFGSDNNNIYALSSHGKLKWSYPTGGAVESSPAIGPDGTLYVGSEDGAIYAFAGPLRSVSKAPAGPAFTPAAKLSVDGRLMAPGALAPASGGKLFVADLLRYRVLELGSKGQTIGALGSRGTGRGQFELPSGVGVGPGGRVFASDAVNDDVQEFVPSGSGFKLGITLNGWKTSGTTRRFAAPLALAVNSTSGDVYVGDARWGIVAFSATGKFIRSWSPGSGLVIHGLSVAPDGQVYATFGSSSAKQATYELNASLSSHVNTGFTDAAGAPFLEVDRSGDLYSLSPQSPASVTKYQPVSGGFNELAFFSTPVGFQYGFALDSSDRIYVPSFGNTPHPRGSVSVYAATDPSDPSSAFRRVAQFHGGKG
jgi:outer membrane protein assembly factor BamB